MLSIARWVHAMYLRWRIWEQEHYTRDAERTGVHTSLDMAAFRKEAATLRVRLIDVERGY